MTNILTGSSGPFDGFCSNLHRNIFKCLDLGDLDLIVKMINDEKLGIRRTGADPEFLDVGFKPIKRGFVSKILPDSS